MFDTSHGLGFARNGAESAYPQLWDGLISSYAPKLGNTGSLIPDYSGRGNNGTQVGIDPATDWTYGKLGQKLDFVGDGQYITVPKDLGGARGTICAWVRPTFNYNVGSPFSHNIVGAGAISGGFFYMYYDSSTSGGTHQRYRFAYRFGFGTTVGVNGTIITSNADFQVWTPVVATWDVAGHQELFVHGVSEASGTTSTNAYPGNTGWRIADAALGNQSWTGGISSVQVYDRVLTDDEIRLLSTRPAILHEKPAPKTFLYLGAGAGAQELTPGLFTNTNTFYAATVAAGAVALTPSLFTDADTFYTQTVTTSYSLTAPLYIDADTFYTPAVAAGAVTLTPSLYSDADTFYTHTITGGAAVLAPSLYTDADTFYAHTVAAGAVTLTPSLYSDADTLYSATVAASYGLTPALFTDADTFYAPTVTGGGLTLQPSLYGDADTFYTHTITGGAVVLTPALYTDADTFYSATVSTSYGLTPALYTSSNTFYTATVAAGAVTLTPSLYANTNTFYVHSISGGTEQIVPAENILSVQYGNTLIYVQRR